MKEEDSMAADIASTPISSIEGARSNVSASRGSFRLRTKETGGDSEVLDKETMGLDLIQGVSDSVGLVDSLEAKE